MPVTTLLLRVLLLSVLVGTLPRCDLAGELYAMYEEYDEFEILSSGFSRLFGVQDIESRQLLAWQNDARPLLLLDVRTPQEQSVSRLPGAITTTTDAALDDLTAVRKFRAQHQNNDRARIVVYCAAGDRSARSMAAMGDQNKQKPPVVNLRGGIIGYANAGGALRTPDGASTQQVHGYNQKWSTYLKPPADAVLEPPIPD